MKSAKPFLISLVMMLLVAVAVGCSETKAYLKKETAGSSLKEEPETPTVKKKIVTSPSNPAQTASPQPSGIAQETPPSQGLSLSPSVPPSVAPVPPPKLVSASTPTPTRTGETPPPKGPGYAFNFDGADLYEVIRVIAEILKISYLIDPKVKGMVSIKTFGYVAAGDVFPIFLSILRLNGATAIQKENLYEIVPLGEAKKFPFPALTPKERPTPDERYTIQIISLKYIPVTEVSKMIRPFLSDGADIVEHPPHNILIIGDIASNVRKALDIISLFDFDIFTDLRVRIYPVLNADVTEISKEMERIFSSFEVSIKSGRGVGITFTPISRINSLLVVSSIPSIFEKVERWLKELDRMPTEGTKLSVSVYYIQNYKAKDLADILKQVYGVAKDKKTEFKEKVVEPAPSRSVRPSPPSPPATQAKEEPGGVPEGEISIVVDETNNALVIRAFPQDYKNIIETIKKLDLYPRQVLIDVLLAEITLKDELRYGLEFMKFLDTLSHGRFQQTIDIGTSTIPGVGIRYSIVEAAGRFSAAIKAAAKDGRLNVISSPHILASNNKEAKIQIGVAQPVLTTTYTTTATATTNVVEGTIEYKDVGIIISVTPRISDGGLVTMDISIEDSSVEETEIGSSQNLLKVPLFKKKTAKTTLSVLEGQMIVIGGLISDSKDIKKSGIPLLKDIPILGALFGTREYVKDKTEMVLLMTPRIVTDHTQSRTVTDEFKEKVEGIKRELEKKEKEKK